MPVVQSDAIQAFTGRRLVTLDTLDEIKPVKQYQAGNSRALIIALCDPHDR